MQNTHERRRNKPSYSIPFLFEGLEITLIWLVFGLFEGSMNVTQWSVVSYALASIWALYTFYKLNKVLKRQLIHQW